MKLTEYQEKLAKEHVETVTYAKIGQKTTVCLLIIKNGFEVVGTSACVNPTDFDYEIGKFYALVDALGELDGLVGFLQQERKFRGE